MTTKYYSIMRPFGIGTCPKRGLIDVENFDRREFVKEIGRKAWGYALYNRELTEEEVRDYELVKA